MVIVRSIAATAATVCLLLLSGPVAAAKSCERSCDESLSACEAFSIAQERALCLRQMNRWCDRFCAERNAATRPAAMSSKKRS
jgi:hypothetical protein